MNIEDIIRMAREAGLGDTGVQCGFVFFQSGAEGLERFFQAAYAAGAAAEREACAKLCDDIAFDWHKHAAGGPVAAYNACAAAIRARGQA